VVAFLKQPPAAPPAAAPAAPPPAAPPAAAAPAGQGAVTPSPTQSGSSVPQGGSATAVEAPRNTGVPAGQNATAPQTSGQSAPIPQAPAPAKAPPVSLQQAEALAGANDIAGCRAAAQTMRKAGVAMPGGLLALAGLRLDLLQQAAR
jgi:hypothetical protein